ncbi:MAG TPA: NAD(P)-binding protein [Acidobacteriota bacterium]|nr:NAD(P)-binding protein [Acidobacteriota bacterium]
MSSKNRITRRDFLNGIAITIGSTLLPGCTHDSAPKSSKFLAEQITEYYPPALTGLRGNHVGSFEVAHELRDGSFWKKAGPPSDTGEEYDLVIVGAGISGLSAAYFYQKHAGKNARILILDNHDDFGGHAKRNEFRTGNRTLLGYGGSFSIDGPVPYSAVAKGLIQELGIDMKRWPKVLHRDVYQSLNLKPTVFFDRETFGSDKVVPFPLPGFWDDSMDPSAKHSETWKTFLQEAPISADAKHDLEKLYTKDIDYMPGLTSEKKKERLARMSYSDFLTKVVKVHLDVVKFFYARAQALYGVGIDAVPAQDAWGLGLPGFDGMKLDKTFGKGMNFDSMYYPEGGEAYFFHFPDGNATITRLIVRTLIPSVLAGNTMDDIVTAHCNYAHLDQASSSTRIRLNSTVVKVTHDGDPASAKSVEIAYVKNKKLEKVKSKHCILACWNAAIPYLCPELPQIQQEALAYEVKVPLLYTNVLISNWHSFVNAGAAMFYCPGSYHSFVSLDMPVSIGSYKCSTRPDEPIVVHMMRTPCRPGLPARQQHQAGRLELVTTPFKTFEMKIRDQLSRMLGGSGFDESKDILAITVNRWAHGYAYQYNSLFDPFWLDGSEPPCERARKPFGRLAIANADAAAYSYADAAIDQAYRAVNEITHVT